MVIGETVKYIFFIVGEVTAVIGTLSLLIYTFHSRVPIHTIIKQFKPAGLIISIILLVARLTVLPMLILLIVKFHSPTEQSS